MGFELTVSYLHRKLPFVETWRIEIILFSEVRTLCEFVKTHKEKLFGLGEEANKKGVNAAKKKHWELAASIINEQFATKRHWSQVRKKWKDLSYYARNPDKRRSKLHNGLD